MTKVSIIIPIYNVKEYLQECIESVLNQTYADIEILLIDDGSEDNSSEICDKYAEQSNKIKVFHIKNGGVSNARNLGIKEATGKYIMFVDSDDVIESQMVEKMVENIENYDMVICGYWEKFRNMNLKHEVTSVVIDIDKEKSITDIFEREGYGGYLWNKIFITNIIKENEIKFNKDIYMCEDLYFVINYMRFCKKIRILPECMYYYRMRKSSMIWKKEKSKFESLFIAYSKIYAILKQEQISMIKFYYSFLISIFLNKGLFNAYMKKKNSKIDYNKIYYDVLKSKEITKSRKIKLIIIRRFKFIYKFYMKRKVTTLQRYD